MNERTPSWSIRIERQADESISTIHLAELHRDLLSIEIREQQLDGIVIADEASRHLILSEPILCRGDMVNPRKETVKRQAANLSDVGTNQGFPLGLCPMNDDAIRNHTEAQW